MYEEHFKLTGKPFQLSPDAAFFYPSKEHKRALSFLEYGLSQADGFIIITGDIGTGKTTLVQTLLKDLDPTEMLVANLVTTQLEEDDLLHLVAISLGLRVSSSSKAIILRDLERLFVQQAREKRRVLLIVDEAQNLPPRSVEELRMLSNFQLDGKPLLQIFLLGQEEFRTTLLSEGFEQLRQRVIATYHLNPLDEPETRTYIEHRLSRVGWQNRPKFSANAFPVIFQFCQGVPRRINNLCDRLLLYAFLEEQDKIDKALVDTVADEIGSEFYGGAAAVKPEVETKPDVSPDEAAKNAPSDQPLETMAKGMFDKANVQQRLGALERAIDSLGHSLKPEVDHIREELSYIRLILEDVMHEVRSMRGHSTRSSSRNPGAKKKRA